MRATLLLALCAAVLWLSACANIIHSDGKTVLIDHRTGVYHCH